MPYISESIFKLRSGSLMLSWCEGASHGNPHFIKPAFSPNSQPRVLLASSVFLLPSSFFLLPYTFRYIGLLKPLWFAPILGKELIELLEHLEHLSRYTSQRAFFFSCFWSDRAVLARCAWCRCCRYYRFDWRINQGPQTRRRRLQPLRSTRAEAFQEIITVPYNLFARKPASLTLEEVASLP